jgi:monoamine oxidase
MKFLIKKIILSSLSLLVLNSSIVAISQEYYDTDVIIAGAGLSGLTASYKLNKKNIKFKIFEISDRVGGRSRTAKYDNGMKVEVGLAEFWDDNPALEIIKELKIPYETGFAYSSCFINGKIYKFNHKSNTDFIKSIFNKNEYNSFLKWDNLVKTYLDKIKEKKIDKNMMKLKDISFSDWVTKVNKLPRKVSEWIRVTIEVEIGTSWQNISALDGIDEWHIFNKGGQKEHYLVNGNETLAQKIAKAVGEDNINLRNQVVRFKNIKDGVEVEIMNTENFEHKTYKAKYAISTIPLFRLAEVQFDPPLPPKIVEAIKTQSWGAYFTAHVFFSPDTKPYWEDKGESILPILSDSPLGVIYSAERNDNKSPYIMNLLITGEHAEKFNYRGMLFDEIKKELDIAFEKLWPGSSKKILKYEFFRYHPRAIASWPVGRSRFDNLSEELRKPYGRIYFAGDFTESSHSDGAVKSAIRVVNDIIKKEEKE